MGLSTSKLSPFNKLCKIYLKRILNSKKSILKEIPSSELPFIALYQKTRTQNSESASFTGLLKSLLALWVLDETRQTWPMCSESKALIHSERFRVTVFQYRAKTINRNSEFSLPSMIPRATKNSKLTFLCIGPKTITHNLEFT